MIGSEDVCCDEGEGLHLRTGALVHGALESERDEAIGEGVVSTAEIDEKTHLLPDLGVDAGNTKNLLQAEVISCQYLCKGESFQLFCIFLPRNHKQSIYQLAAAFPQALVDMELKWE